MTITGRQTVCTRSSRLRLAQEGEPLCLQVQAQNCTVTLENLFRMRPAGVVSKKYMGALATWAKVELTQQCEPFAAID